MRKATIPHQRCQPDATVVRIETRIAREQLEAFRLIAGAHRRSISNELRCAIDRHIAEFEEQAA